MKVSILCFDVSSNAFARAWLIAKALSKFYDIEILGPSKRGGIWSPLEQINIPVKVFDWERYPKFSKVTKKILKAIDGDVILASKPMPTSFGIGLQKQSNDKPLILDIDDWELGFFYHAGIFGRIGRFLNFSNPNGLPYVWKMERFIGKANRITVSNRFLQNKFGGTLLPHCRDTSTLDPLKFNPNELKNKIGLKEKKVLMFLGTPRPHKGIADLLHALKIINNPDLCLAIVGVDNQFEFLKKVDESVKRSVVVLPKIPFNKLPEYLSAADIVIIPQRRTSDSIGQMPAKLYDAMAMAKPIIATKISDIPEVLDNVGYLVNPSKPSELAGAIQYVLNHPEEAFNKGKAARERCQQMYDLRILESGFHKLIEEVSLIKNCV